MEAVALSLELTRLASSAFRYVFLAWEVISFRPVRYHYSDLKKRFGGFQALLLIAIFPDARQIVHRIERHVLDTEEEEALVLRKSTSEDCTMLAVAVRFMRIFPPALSAFADRLVGSHCGSSRYYGFGS